ncbi:ATP-binding cassette domain-containing protein [Congregibacter variabilis]|uniref:ATP-binding cassette domain-containing protein n=1 Tax=Congregibacter variabilis TaxID=3081200 RepID=A0ABZ0HZT3_9GAMM|nr:ATP-binding cassette domain-containing protein [Congregibacter sp. IMCC43200]
MGLIELRSVSKCFAKETVLHDISLEFAKGCVTAVVGASGCGKSTILKLCNGLLKPDGGEVRAFGEPLDYQHIAQIRQRMGYAVQGTGLFPHLSAADNISIGAQVAGWPKQRRKDRMGELLSLMHLDEALLQRYPHELSGGQQQRVGLCRAMMLRPQVLLLDEPFAAIDPITRFDIHQQLLQLLAAEPVTVVLVTHDMREAMLLAQQIVVMDKGVVRVNESTAKLHAQQPDLEPEALLQSLMSKATR